MITAAQSRMARAGLGWTVRDLAARAGVAAATVNRFEMGHASPNRATLAVLERTLTEAGIVFIPENGCGPGVRLRGPQPPATP